MRVACGSRGAASCPHLIYVLQCVYFYDIIKKKMFQYLETNKI